MFVCQHRFGLNGCHDNLPKSLCSCVYSFNTLLVSAAIVTTFFRWLHILWWHAIWALEHFWRPNIHGKTMLCKYLLSKHWVFLWSYWLTHSDNNFPNKATTKIVEDERNHCEVSSSLYQHYLYISLIFFHQSQSASHHPLIGITRLCQTRVWKGYQQGGDCGCCISFSFWNQVVANYSWNVVIKIDQRRKCGVYWKAVCWFV